MSLLIAVLSVMNNLFVSFIKRKHALAVMRSVGMSKIQSIKIVFLEALMGGIIGGVMEVGGGILMISIIPAIVKAINQNIVGHYPQRNHEFET